MEMGNLENHFFAVCLGLGTQWFLAFFPEVKSLDMMFTINPSLAPRSRIIGAIPLLSHMPYMARIAFLDTFAKLRKELSALSFLSIGAEQLCSHHMDFHEILYLSFFFFKSVTIIQLS